MYSRKTLVTSLLLILLGLLIFLRPSKTTPLAGLLSQPKSDTKNESLALQNKSLQEDIASSSSTSPTVKSHYQRGKNQKLLYPRESTQKRSFVVGKVFPYPIFQKRAKDTGSLTHHEFSTDAIELDFSPELIKTFLNSDAEQFSIPISDRKEVNLSVTQHTYRGAWTDTLLGHVSGDPDSQVLLVVHDGVVSGSLVFYQTNEHYEFGSTGDGGVAVRYLDPSQYTAPCGLNEATETAAHDTLTPHQNALAPTSTSSAESVEAETVITADTVVGYGASARASEGGVASIEAKIIASVDRSNLAFTNSEIDNAYLSLRATIEDPDYVFPGVDSSSMGSVDELGDLNNESDGILDTISDLRVQLGADHQAFVVNGVDGSAGVAYRPGRSMIVARTYMTSTRITFVHELGHNIGCRHGWGDSDGGTTNHNYGWRLKTAGGTQYRTVMAYDWGWSRIPYFSNPAVSFLGLNTGAVDGYDVTGDTTTDSRFASGGYEGSYGAGFNGTNSSLGARNADYIVTNYDSLADNLDRLANLVLSKSDGTVISPDQITEIIAPLIGSEGSETFKMFNQDVQTHSNITLSLNNSVESSFEYTEPTITSLAPGDSTQFTISFTASDEATSGSLKISSQSSLNHTETYSIDGVDKFGIENFETNTGAWNSASLDLDWSRDTSTPSFDTGPANAQLGDYFIFTEASGSNRQKEFGLQTTVDFSEVSDPSLNFYYHMFGATTGSLHVEVQENGVWEEVWSVSGQQHLTGDAAWSLASVDLSNYAAQSAVMIRLRGVTGSSYTSDISVDHLFFRGRVPFVSTLNTWAIHYGLSGEQLGFDASPAGDAINNLLKYAFNLEPITAYSTQEAKLIAGTGTAGLPLVTPPNESDAALTLEFIRRTNASDIVYTPQFTSNLDETWTTPTANIIVTTIDAEWERVSIEDTETPSTQEKRFARVQISVQE